MFQVKIEIKKNFYNLINLLQSFLFSQLLSQHVRASPGSSDQRTAVCAKGHFPVDFFYEELWLVSLPAPGAITNSKRTVLKSLNVLGDCGMFFVRMEELKGRTGLCGVAESVC